MSRMGEVNLADNVFREVIERAPCGTLVLTHYKSGDIGVGPEIDPYFMATVPKCNIIKFLKAFENAFKQISENVDAYIQGAKEEVARREAMKGGR